MEALFKVTKAQFGGRIDIVVNNAGICHEGAWERMIDINVKVKIIFLCIFPRDFYYLNEFLIKRVPDYIYTGYASSNRNLNKR